MDLTEVVLGRQQPCGLMLVLQRYISSIKKELGGHPLTLFVISIFVPSNVRLELISQNFLVVQMNLQDN